MGVKVSVNVGVGFASNVVLAFDGGEATSLTLDEAEQLGKTLQKAVKLAKKGL